MLMGWELDNSRAWYTKTTPETRKQVALDLTNAADLAEKISRMILQIVASCGEEFQNKTVLDWYKILSVKGPFKQQTQDEWERHRWDPHNDEYFHKHFVSEFKDYLNRVVVSGVDTRAACDVMISCVQKCSDGTFHFYQDMFHSQIEKEVKARQVKLNEQRQAEVEQQARENALRKRLEDERDAKSRETAPAAQPDAEAAGDTPAAQPDAPAEAKATPKKPFSIWDYKTWRRDQERPSDAHIRELLSRMQELNSQSI
jgi:hypothetical protein